MSDSLNEQVSACVDDELDPAESGLLLRRLSADAESRARWERYHLISDTLKNNLPAQLPVDLVARVSAAVDQLDQQAAPYRRFSAARLLKPAAGLGIAAAVAALAIIAVRNPLPESGQTRVATLAPAIVAPQAPILRTQGTHWDRAQPEVAAHLNTYLLNHSGHAETAGMHTVPPYVRIVGYDVGE